MTCRELYGFLDEFLDGGLDPAIRQNFDRHLAACASCRRYLESYRTTLSVARKSELADTPARTEAPEELVLAVLHARNAAFSRQPPE